MISNIWQNLSNVNVPYLWFGLCIIFSYVCLFANLKSNINQQITLEMKAYDRKRKL